MKFVKISQSELEETRKLYESVMSYACHGLFFREGVVYGDKISEIAQRSSDTYFSSIERILKGRGWVDEISFGEKEVVVKGSIEVSPGSEVETCHRMRGMLSKIYEKRLGKRMRCMEVSCESTGGNNCVFVIEPEVLE